VLLKLGTVNLSAAAERFGVVRIEPNGLFEVVDRRLRLAHFAPNDTPAQEGFRVVRLEANGLIEIGQGLVVLAKVSVSVPPNHIEIGKLRLALDGLVKVFYGPLVIAQNEAPDGAPFLVGFCEIRLKLNGSVQISDCFLVLTQTNSGEAAREIAPR